MAEKIAEIVEKIKQLSLVEASELKKALEDEFGVTAAAPVMMAGAAPAGGGRWRWRGSRRVRRRS